MTMNKIKFSEGGQPVYLDDLQLLQDNDTSAMAALVKMLGNGENVFLFQKGGWDVIEQDESGVTVLIKAETFIANGEFLSWEDTNLQVPYNMIEEPVYLCINTVEADRRQFDDGQERPCRIARKVYISQDNTGAAEYYNYYELPVLSDLVKQMVGIKEPELWQQITAHFFNGYSGIIKYKDLGDCYRVRVDIRSNSKATIDGSILLFATDKTFLQYFRSSCEAYVRTGNGVIGGQLLGFEGNVRLDIQLPFDDASCPADVPVRIVFELPK